MSAATPPADGPLRWNFWQNSARVARLARKELLEVVRDKRTIITLVLMPLLLYPLLSFAFRQYLVALIPAKDAERPLTIGVGSAEARDHLERVFFEAHDVEFVQAAATVGLLAPSGAPGPWLAGATASAGASLRDPAGANLRDPAVAAAHPVPLGSKAPPPVAVVVVDDLGKALEAGEIDVAVLIVPNLVRRDDYDFKLFYADLGPRTRALVSLVEDTVRQASARKLRRKLENLRLPPFVTTDLVPYRVVREPSQTTTDSAAMLSLTALVPLILILMTITGAVYPAIDLTAGERERGTLEILVAAPVPRIALLLGKYAAVLCVAVLTAAINLTMMLVTLEFNGLTREVFKHGITVPLVGQLLFLLILFAAFFSAVLLALTSFARSFKEAQAYLIPLMLVSLAPGVLAMMPGLHLTGVLTATPLVNIVLLARDLSEGDVPVNVIVVVVGSTIVYAAAAIAGAARIFGAEAVLYSEQSGWADLLRRPRAPRATASVAGVLFWLALVFPVLFAFMGLMPVGLEPEASLASLVAISYVLYLGFPLLALVRGRVNLVSGLQLRRPPWASLPAALVLGVAATPLILQLLTWLRDSGLTFQGPGAERLFREEVRRWRDVPTWLVAGTFALIGVAEEVFFRGLLFSALRATTTRGMTIAGSALLFGLCHAVLRVDQLVPATLMGLVLGWVCWQTRSVVPGMLLHAAYNAALIVLALYQTPRPAPRGEGGRGMAFGRVLQPLNEIPWEWQLGGLAAGLLAAAVIWWWRVRDGETDKAEIRNPKSETNSKYEIQMTETER
jgi:ABC-2 type transport system permease protein/sodium transport system permease protein